jgi:translation initiation factor IF-2
MADKKDPNGKEKKTLRLSKSVEFNKIVDAGQIRQSFSHGRSKTVSVEVKKKRTLDKPSVEEAPPAAVVQEPETPIQQPPSHEGKLSETEWETRLKAVQDAKKYAEDQKLRAEQLKEEMLVLEKKKEEEKATRAEEETLEEVAAEGSVSSSPGSLHKETKDVSGKPQKVSSRVDLDDEIEEEAKNRKSGLKGDVKKTLSVSKKGDIKKQLHRLTIEAALEDTETEKMRSLASLKRAREKEKQKLQAQQFEDAKKIVREVVIPEVITVQELSNRMAIRSAEVIKTLMRLGVMATINQVLDTDTAELVVREFGHTPKKVSEADVEVGLIQQDDDEGNKQSRPPVVTVMGHVDHGKTSLLDAIRKSSIVSQEAGGITQHIGAYQVTMPTGKKITFIDTPGHAAFSQMRARGANVTDVVVLVVAADDGVMEQTIEAINHAKAAEVPLIVAINKIDKPDAKPDRVRSELLQHGIVVEQMGGDNLSVEVSAKNNINIDKLEELILLQAELLDLKANPDRPAQGAVIEAKIETGRGPVATVLVQKGTLKVGDIFVAGSEWGKVRALIDFEGKKCEKAPPSSPVEVLGFTGTPAPGDDFVVVENETRAKDVAEFRKSKQKFIKAGAVKKITLDQLLSQAAASGKMKELSVIVKSDVQGSLEAISQSLTKLTQDNEEVSVKVIHTGVGAINESDISLAAATNALVIGFNVRANPQARDIATRSGIQIRYYSVIYNIIDDIKLMLSGLLSPTLREKFLGNAQIREVFNITKVGKVAGCFVTEGQVKRGANVRLLRDNVVIHEGKLKTLKRFKDEVKEVKEGYECGMAFENYNDIRAGDVIECFEVETIARQL